MTFSRLITATMHRALRRAGYAVVPADRLAYLEAQAVKALKAANLGMLAEGELGRALGLLGESFDDLRFDRAACDWAARSICSRSIAKAPNGTS